MAEDKTDCAVHYTRTACIGQEAVSHKNVMVKSHAQNTSLLIHLNPVKTQFLNSCESKRLDMTKSKVITAMYNGKPI
jgi:hypothetical protein